MDINDRYPFGHNGKLKDNEIAGYGNNYDYGYRKYDPRLGRFWSADPLKFDYPWNSVYAFAENDVIRAIDLDGLEKYIIEYFTDPITGVFSNRKMRRRRSYEKDRRPGKKYGYQNNDGSWSYTNRDRYKGVPLTLLRCFAKNNGSAL